MDISTNEEDTADMVTTIGSLHSTSVSEQVSIIPFEMEWTNEDSANSTSQEPKVDDCWNYLPNEILIEIFIRCPRTDFESIGKVCERFQWVIQHPALWKKISLTHSHFAGRSLEKILAPYEGIAEVDLSGSTVDWSTFMSDYWRNTGHNDSLHLEKLNLSNVRFENPTLDRWSNHVAYVENARKDMHLNGIGYMLRKFKPKKLIIKNVTLRTVLRIFWSYNKLEAISLENMTSVGSEGIFYPFFFLATNLREINVSNSKLDAHQLRELCYLPNWTEKFMLNNVNLTPQYLEIFNTIVSSASDLKCLGVSLEYLKDLGVLALLIRLEQLEALRLYHDEWERLAGEKLEFVFIILEKLPTLKYLHFVTEQGDDLSQLQKEEIEIEVATLRNPITTLLAIDTRAEIDCDWRLHFTKLTPTPWDLYRMGTLEQSNHTPAA